MTAPAARSHAALRAGALAPTAAGRAAQVSSVPEPATRTRLRANVLGLGSSITIGVSSAAPAYSLAAVLAVLAGSVRLHAPAALLLAFIPMVCTAAAYNAFDRIAPDAGSVFAWLWRAVGWERDPFGGSVGVVERDDEAKRCD